MKTLEISVILNVVKNLRHTAKEGICLRPFDSAQGDRGSTSATKADVSNVQSLFSHSIRDYSIVR